MGLIGRAWIPIIPSQYPDLSWPRDFTPSQMDQQTNACSPGSNSGSLTQMWQHAGRGSLCSEQLLLEIDVCTDLWGNIDQAEMQRTEPCAEGMKCHDVKVQGTSCKVGVGVGWGGSGDITDFLSTSPPGSLRGKGAGRIQWRFWCHMEGTGGLLFLSSSGQGSWLPHYCEWVTVL